ncbi:hypothetical protein ACP70R_041967 [Stipagrostis hirtigluma subsp. patula]
MRDDSDSTKRTRYPCLDTARWMTACVVYLSLVVVLVLVIISVAARPENMIRLSVLHGHVKADALWSKREKLIDGGRTAVGSSRSCDRGSDGDVGLGGGGRSEEPCSYQFIVVYSAEKNVTLRFRLTADNPSGGADINCTDMTIRFLDMPDAPLFTRMVEIAVFHLPEQILVKRRSSNMLRKWLTVNDTGALHYIARTYGGRSSFEAMVQMTTTISSTKQARKRKVVVHYCWPVTIGVDFPSTFSEDITCKPRQDIDYPIDYELPAPAPAPIEASG